MHLGKDIFVAWKDLFLSIPGLYFIQFIREIYMENVLQELFWVHFFGHPYRSNGTKTDLDAALI